MALDFNDSLYAILKATLKKEKMGELNFIKITTVWLWKILLRGPKKQITEWKKKIVQITSLGKSEHWGNTDMHNIFLKIEVTA